MLENTIKYLKIAILLGILGFEFYYLGKYFIDENSDKGKDSFHYILNIDEAITVKMSQKIISKLNKLKDEDKLKSLLVVLDTPGGSPVASENLYSYLKNLNIKKYIYINSSATSGGYYIAVSGDKIYANKNALIGSIGVIMQNISFSKLSREIGIEDETLSAGEYKHLLSPLKNMDEKTKEYLKEYLLKPIYENFASTVAFERKIKKEDREKYFEGKIFIAGDKRIKNILVDEVLSYPQMLSLIKKENAIERLEKLEYKEKFSENLSNLFTLFKVFEDKNLSIEFK